MKYTETEIEGVWLIEPRVFDDARGYFFEAWKQADFAFLKAVLNRKKMQSILHRQLFMCRKK